VISAAGSARTTPRRLRRPHHHPPLGATALEQARAAGKFTPVHDAWWAAARKAHGDRDGTRALIQVLLLHRHMLHEHVVAGLAAAVSVQIQRGVGCSQRASS
jgi:hypothetical protein